MNRFLREFFSPEFQKRHHEHFMSVPHVVGSGCNARVKAAFIEEPPSHMIVEWLEVLAARTCPHDRNPCYLRCGVRSCTPGRWQIIPPWGRELWLQPNRIATLLPSLRLDVCEHCPHYATRAQCCFCNKISTRRLG